MDIQALLINQRKYFESLKEKDVSFRLEMLDKLKSAIIQNESKIYEALRKDLGKSEFESYMTEIGMVLEEISYTKKHLKKWVKEKKVKTPLAQFYSSSFVKPSPYGVVLIISPWNYPFYLTLAPLVGAIASGNCAVIKPSAYSHNTSNLIYEIISNNFDKAYISVVLGGREENIKLLDNKFDYIFFTGSKNVGRYVMKKASEFLTPVTLELGGKSPCIVEKSADLYVSAKRTVFGKIINSGQTCVAPDYILVEECVKDEFLYNVKKVLDEFVTEEEYKNIPKIINEKHFNRICDLLKGEDIFLKGDIDRDNMKIYPTVIDNVKWESKIMQEEIFAPLIPVLTFNDIDDIIKKINERPKPLSLYLFTKNKSIEKKVLNNVSFGGGCVNDTVIHLATPYMSFGGVGESGMGSYHGKSSFDTFTHYKSILKKSFLIDLYMRYHPYSDKKLKLIKKFLK